MPANGQWRDFEEAREFARALGLQSAREWETWAKSGERPSDIPRNPRAVAAYRDQWKGFRDWLGTKNMQWGVWRSFEEAREYARSLGLENQSEWLAWTKSGEKPDDIPVHPEKVYKDRWQGLGDWLGSNRVRRRGKGWRPFEEAREFVRSLGLSSSSEWRGWAKSGERPNDIPASPDRGYKEQWKGWGDWVGTGNVKSIEYRPFEEARRFVRSLGLKSLEEWSTWAKSGAKPDDIPSNPSNVAAYKGQWAGYGDWLGTGRVRHGNISWRPFEEAREFARSLGLKSAEEWREWAKNGTRPKDVPASPRHVYIDQWEGWGDWLGTGVRRRGGWGDPWRPFEEAREFARTLGFNSQKEWTAWSNSGARPADIPTHPRRVYKRQWQDWGDWLGSNRVRRRGEGWRSFDEAREFVRSFSLSGEPEWRTWAKSEERPSDIPTAPHLVYEGEWRGLGDWLGTGAKRRGEGWRPFDEAREFARSLNLKYQEEWRAWVKSGDRPKDIPADPSRAYPGLWRGIGDWLGTGWRPFEEARGFVQSLGLKDYTEWREWARSEARPEDIPASPEGVYKEYWQGIGDWLGTGRRAARAPAGGWRPFEEAREYARSLGLKSFGEWREWAKGTARPDDIPSSPSQLYKGQWKGWGDWLGYLGRRKWTQLALIKLLEDLRPRLPYLSEAALYTILQEGQALPILQRKLGSKDRLSVIRDLKENGGAGIEAALSSADDIEYYGGDEDEDLAEADGVLGDFEETLDLSGGLMELTDKAALHFVDEWAALPYHLDSEAAEFLVKERVAALWERYTRKGNVGDLLDGEGGYYFDTIRSRFFSELGGAMGLEVPKGWYFRVNGTVFPPNMMQRRTAWEVMTKHRVGNWSGVGAGKTLAAILASRVVDAKHTLIVTANATISGWVREIKNAYPDSVVFTEVSDLVEGRHNYTVLNYEDFQHASRGVLLSALVDLVPEFVILDEVQLVKQRDRKASLRRSAIEGLLSTLAEENPNLYVLGMSATPVINTLLEARKLLEIVKGESYADLNTRATVNSALAVHRALMIGGFRYRPRYDIEMDVKILEVDGNHMLDDLMAAKGVLGVEQALLPAKLEAIKPYLRPGAVIYTHYVEGMLWPTRLFLEDMGYRVGAYTGDDKSGLEPFLLGRVDILLGSKPIGTGLDGLQRVADRLIIVSPPWTSAEDEQIKGRLRRQGSAFGKVSVIVPQVILERNGEEWSWDRGRWNTIHYKRTLSDCAVDGTIPTAAAISPNKLLSESKEALEKWIERVSTEGPGQAERAKLRVPLPPSVRKRVEARRGGFTEINNRWSTSNSSTVGARLKENPEEWYLYHTLYREAREGWEELPAHHFASHLKVRPDFVVGDFGSGECLLRGALPDHRVVGFDYVANDDSVIEGDMAHTPLEDGTLGAAVFSLSLMGRNWKDYLVEAHRVLRPFGLILVAEPAKKWAGGALEGAIGELFKVVDSYQRGDFLYVVGVKL